MTNLLLKADLKIQIFIKFTFSHHTSKKFLHYSWVLKIGLMWSWLLCELSLPSFPCYSFLCHATVQGHPYSHRQMFFQSTIMWSIVAKNRPITRESFNPIFTSAGFGLGLFFISLSFLMAVQTHRKIKNNCRANLELIDPMDEYMSVSWWWFMWPDLKFDCLSLRGAYFSMD